MSPARSSHSARAIAPVIALAVLLVHTGAPPAHAARGASLAMTVGVGSMYDSNILQYSDGQITDFESGLHPARYSVRTTDDAIFIPSLALTGEIDQGHGRKHALRLRYEGDFHDRNGTSDMHAWSASWRESFRHDRHVALGYYTMPSFYLRQLFAEDWTAVPASVRYKRADFSLGIASASYGQRIAGDVSLDADYQHERRVYNTDFMERSSGLNQERLGVGYDALGRNGAVRAYGGYRDEKAKGVDGDEIAGQPSDDADVGYHGAIAGASLRYEFARARRWRWGGDIAYEFEARNFTSPLATDKYHFGRHDRLHAVELGLRSAVRPHVAMRGFFRHETNIAHLGASAPLTTDAGSYHVHQFGLSVEWTGDLWSARR